MNENTMQTIIEALAKAYENEKLLREYYEIRVIEMEKEKATSEMERTVGFGNG